MYTKSRDCTVLVASCDAYADVVGPFATLKQKYWPDCPFETVLVTETAPAAPLPGIDRVLACGSGGTWCSRLVKALDALETPYVLMLCEDYYLEAPVDTALILRRLEQAKAYEALNLRLIPNPETKIPYRDGLGNTERTRPTASPPRRESGIAASSGAWRRGRRASGSLNAMAALT